MKFANGIDECKNLQKASKQNNDFTNINFAYLKHHIFSEFPLWVTCQLKTKTATATRY